MKKIVPFNNVLTFNTDVREITAISLEHDINTDTDIISGAFYISGEYKITDGQLEKEKFNFELPFDIALGNDYDLDTLLVDIDDFRYELIDRNKLKINIDLYVDGEIIESPIEIPTENRLFEEQNNFYMEDTYKEDVYKENIEDSLKESVHKEDTEDLSRCLSEEDIEPIKNTQELVKETYIDEIIDEPIPMPITENLDLLDEMLDNNKEKTMKEEKIDNTNINIENNNESTNQEVNIFNGFNEEERYVTYRVYRVLDNDTIDKILEKYNVTKEELSKYNNIEDIKPGDKLIIPTNDK